MPTGHHLLWGAGYRRTRDTNEPSPAVLSSRPTRTLSWTNACSSQHESQATKALHLTLGAKAERNDYTGIELLPTARLSYQHSPAGTHLAGAVARGARPGAARPRLLLPGRAAVRDQRRPQFRVGGRQGAGDRAPRLCDGRHSRIRSPHSTSATTGCAAAARRADAGWSNQIEGHVNGLEGWASWQATRAWRLSAGFLQLRKHLRSTRGTPDPGGVANLGNDPRHQWTLRSSLTSARAASST